jgi:DNA polymerase
MARARVKPFTGSASLASTTQYLGLGEPKGTMAQHAKGIHKHEMPPAFLDSYGTYARLDIDLSHRAAKTLLPAFSMDEIRLIDRTMRMYLEPRLQLDPLKLTRHYDAVIRRKAALMALCNTDKDILMSNDRFAEALREAGVEPPVKLSPTTGKITYAMAKKDLDFIDLLEHPSERVQGLMAARLGVKSTIEETRTQRLLDIAIEFNGELAVPLLYAGAHTGRFSGGGKLNLQNLPSDSPIRDAIHAAFGWLIVRADARQIEARLLAWFCRQTNIVEAFRSGTDVYTLAAEGIGQGVSRAVGKVATLQLGYGSGASTFWHMCRVQEIDISMGEAEQITDAWRQNNPHIVRMWYKLFGRVKSIFLRGLDREEEFGCITIGYSTELDSGYIELPGGYTIWYPSPRMAEDKYERNTFGYFKATRAGAGYHKSLWHGEIMNNVIQGLARVITMQHGLEISAYPAAPWVLQVHDELVFVVKDVHAKAVAAACELVMSTPPDWCPDLPLAAEVGIGRTYKEAK